MPVPSLPEFLDASRVARAAESYAARCSSAADLAQRGVADVMLFAASEVAQQHARIDAAAHAGEPSDKDFRDALGGDEAGYVVKLVAMEARAQAAAARADTLDVEAAERLQELKRRVRDLLTPPEALEVLRTPSFWRSMTTIVQTVTSSVDSASVALPVPEELRRMLAEAAVGLVAAEAWRSLADGIQAQVLAHRRAIEKLRRSAEAILRAVAKVRDRAISAQNARPTRKGVLPYDLVLDGPNAVKALLHRAPRLDWSELILAHSDGLDDGTAESLVLDRLADFIQDVAQQPFPDLLHELLGDRTPESVFDLLVRNGSPLAPVRPHEAEDGFAGLSIGVVEACDERIAAVLASALKRARDVAILTVDTPLLPAPDVKARVVRFRGVLGSEALSGVAFDLYERLGDPGLLGLGATRDWIDALPELVSEARLRHEIGARQRRGASTILLEKWLPAGSLPVAAPTPTPVDASPTEATAPGGSSTPVAEAK